VGSPTLRTQRLGDGWEQTERALADLGADLSRTVPDAPKLMLLWYDDAEQDRRHAYVGKAADWYYGAEGGFDLSPDYTDSVLNIAHEVQGAVADNLLGYLWAWPLCPTDRRLLSVSVQEDRTCFWVCGYGDGHVVAKVGDLGSG
jgi:hypothetical protein